MLKLDLPEGLPTGCLRIFSREAQFPYFWIANSLWQYTTKTGVETASTGPLDLQTQHFCSVFFHASHHQEWAYQRIRHCALRQVFTLVHLPWLHGYFFWNLQNTTISYFSRTVLYMVCNTSPTTRLQLVAVCGWPVDGLRGHSTCWSRATLSTQILSRWEQIQSLVCLLESDRWLKPRWPERYGMMLRQTSLYCDRPFLTYQTCCAPRRLWAWSAPCQGTLSSLILSRCKLVAQSDGGDKGLLATSDKLGQLQCYFANFFGILGNCRWPISWWSVAFAWKLPLPNWRTRRSCGGAQGRDRGPWGWYSNSGSGANLSIL